MTLRIPLHDPRPTQYVMDDPHDMAGSVHTTDSSSTQPVASTQPSDGSGGSGATGSGGSNTSSPSTSSAPPADLPTQFSNSQWSTINSAIEHAFAGISKGETISQIDSSIQTFLQSSGQFTSQEISAIMQGASSASTNSGNFVEQANKKGVKGGDGGAALMSQWANGIQNYVNGWLSDNANSNASNTNNGGNSSLVGQLAGMLGSIGGSPSIPTDTTGSATDTTPTVVPVTSTSNPGIMIALLLFVVAGAAVWFYYKKHHAA